MVTLPQMGARRRHRITAPPGESITWTQRWKGGNWTTSGGEVLTWNTELGGGTALTRASAAGPVANTDGGPNGKPWCSTDFAVRRSMKASFTHARITTHLLAVVRFSSTFAVTHVFDGWNQGTLLCLQSAGDSVQLNGALDWTNMVAGEWFCLEIRCDTGLNYIGKFGAGSPATDGGSASVALGGLFISTHDLTALPGFGGAIHFAEIALADHILTAGERATWQNYLTAEYGL